MNSRKHSAGKGDTYRRIDYKKWSENYDKIFKKKVKKQNEYSTRRSNNR